MGILGANRDFDFFRYCSVIKLEALLAARGIGEIIEGGSRAEF